MTDQDLKKFKEAVKEELKPVHGEVALIKQKLTDLNINSLKTSTKVDANTRELARLDSTLGSFKEEIKESIEEFKDWAGEEFGKANLKLDDLIEDKVRKEKEIKEIKKHLGLAVN